jgi:hypothetical protein
MIYCNPVPIAAACLLEKGVVADGLQAIFNAIIDLTKYGKDVSLAFGFAQLSIIDKSLKVVFKKDFAQSIQDKTFQNKVSPAFINIIDEEIPSFNFISLEDFIQQNIC